MEAILDGKYNDHYIKFDSPKRYLHAELEHAKKYIYVDAIGRVTYEHIRGMQNDVEGNLLIPSVYDRIMDLCLERAVNREWKEYKATTAPHIKEKAQRLLASLPTGIYPTTTMARHTFLRFVFSAGWDEKEFQDTVFEIKSSEGFRTLCIIM